MLNTIFISLASVFAIMLLGFLGYFIWRAFHFNLAQQSTHQSERKQFDEHQFNALKLIQDSIKTGMQDVRTQIIDTLRQHSEVMDKSVNRLTEETQKKLAEINHQVDKQLTAGFEKTTATFSDVVKRLTIIDEAQKRITELSSNVVSLQEILSDKRSRGAFGEVQLSALIRNMVPESHFELQSTLSNGKRVDCLLFLPNPTGNIAIDAKFPLESYQTITTLDQSVPERKQAQQQFRIDIKKHIQDISQKYIISGETAEGAIMFIPAEAIFAEIHGHYPDLVEFSHKSHVWMASPTTMMAILTTSRAVLKDAATRKQINIIQEHLIGLSKDFERFQKRMDNLSRHIHQAKEDVELVHKSSQKITSRFQKIEHVEMTPNKIAVEEEA